MKDSFRLLKLKKKRKKGSVFEYRKQMSDERSNERLMKMNSFNRKRRDSGRKIAFKERRRSKIEADIDAANGDVNEMEIDDENMADEMLISSSSDVNSGMIFLLCRLYI